ncbi:hypothetical protein GCM10008170_10870 [Methylopila capsulata]|uniref:Uncharacterized protein n=1 Tax=Methylopila capsulata TaxID=61654 RepID=A0A9W6IRC0_9HYPH|nr:hypothetical protein GCM10008170_10870 [Methylopila capsulata]
MAFRLSPVTPQIRLTPTFASVATSRSAMVWLTGGVLPVSRLAGIGAPQRDGSLRAALRRATEPPADPADQTAAAALFGGSVALNRQQR